MTSNPLVSIIVPVYRSEKYLDKCIESILAQTYSTWELLLVDDGSPDKSGEICDKWSKKDKRINVFHKINGGVSSARNIGINNANGEWICFIDSDDYVYKDYLYELISETDEDTDIVYANYDTFKSVPYKTKLEIKSAIDFMREHHIFNMSGPVAKLYKAKLVLDNNITFPIGIHMGEDAIFNIKMLNFARYIAFTPCNNYCYNHNEGSLSTKYYNFESEYNAYKIWKKEELNLFSKFYTPDEALKIVWEVRIAEQFNRVLQCVYRYRPHYSLIAQVKLLKRIKDIDIKEYEKYFHTTVLRRKFNKFLITNRIFKIYVLVGLLDHFIFKG